MRSLRRFLLLLHVAGDSLFHCGIPEMNLQWMFNFMTSSEDLPRFKELISVLDMRTLMWMASSLTSDSNCFMVIARNQYGSKSIQRLMGMSDDVDVFFFAAIMRLFLDVMTDKYASYVAIQGMRVFQQDKRELMYEHILRYALYLARDKYGCIALNEIITDLDDPYYRNQLLDIVANNALLLSNDAYGNFVVQHRVDDKKSIRDYRCTRNIADNLCGHCVELSFKKYGSYIVERLLEVGDSVMELVVMDLLACKREMLMRLARSEYGNFVVCNALELTEEILTADLFYDLVRKLKPYRHLLRRSPGSKIAAILDSMPTSQTS
ncbi:Armadillo-type fold [Arabidopsis thaliana x Arabidopsis arenosa]|uniref:Armadillo-type fold n=1 Tax=Arabidopsis thaliana x Arabidopsis arenosa TaxID=1240361 RepID=A0A8T1XRA7_9BRAS|nr:Armadillo-type fold [Arabidopsis thaliana x Arabidopsis arenosa]